MYSVNSSGSDPCLTPLIPNPSGGPSNFINPTTFEPITLGTGVTLMIISSVCVGLRVANNVKKVKRPLIDDYLCLIGLAFAFGLQIVKILDDRGWSHAWNISECNANSGYRTRISIARWFLYFPAMLFSKLTVCALYLRLFESIRFVRYSSWILIVLYACLYSIGVIIGFIQLAATSPALQNINVAPYETLLASFTLLVDVILLALPIKPILKLSLPLNRRIGLLAVLLAGIGATLCSIFTLIFRLEFYYSAPVPITDWTWVAAWLDCVADLEIFITIILSCVPGIVSAWREFIRDTIFVVRIQSVLGISRKTSHENHHNNDNIMVLNVKNKADTEAVEHVHNGGEIDFRLINTNEVVSMHSTSIRLSPGTA